MCLYCSTACLERKLDIKPDSIWTFVFQPAKTLQCKLIWYSFQNEVIIFYAPTSSDQKSWSPLLKTILSSQCPHRACCLSPYNQSHTLHTHVCTVRTLRTVHTLISDVREFPDLFVGIRGLPVSFPFFLCQRISYWPAWPTVCPFPTCGARLSFLLSYFIAPLFPGQNNPWQRWHSVPFFMSDVRLW